MVEALKVSQEIKQLSDDEAKLVALEAYVAAPVIRFKDIARTVRRPTDVVKQWADEHSWLDVRVAHRRNQKDKVVALVGDPVQARLQILQDVDKLLGRVSIYIHRSDINIHRVKYVAEALSELHKLREKIVAQLGV